MQEQDLSLEGKEFSPDISWPDLRRQFEEAKQLPTCLGLLHRFFDATIVSWDQEVDRLVQTCRLADGYLQSKNLKGESEAHIRRKAFEVLAHRYFSHPPGTIRRLRQLPPAALEAFVWFFRPEQRIHHKGNEEGRGLYNLEFWTNEKKDRSRDMARDFISELIKSIFGGSFFYNPYPGEHANNTETLESARSLKPKLIEILHAQQGGVSKRLVLLPLLGAGSFPEWPVFDDACLKKLEELALAQHFYGGNDVVSVEEAVLAGSSAAQLLVLIRTAKAEAAKREEIERRKHELAEVRRRLEELTQQVD
jgi:hypothetical protein